MRMVSANWIRTVILMLMLGSGSTARGFDHDHTSFTGVLTRFVDGSGRVDYAGLKQEPEDLYRYLGDLARVEASEYRAWTADQQLAYLINLHNAQTLELVVRHYPVGSIKDIGTLLIGPWGQPVVHLFGRATTLDFLANRLIDPVFGIAEARLALVTAAMSSPPLRREPYVAERLADQLREQAWLFLSRPDALRVDYQTKTLFVTSILKWHGDLFERTKGPLIDYLKGFLPPEARDQVAECTIRFLPFDWRLNDAGRLEVSRTMEMTP